jgi:WD40 repeat protein
MPELQATDNPYVGLRPFDRDDSFYFFGRREQTAETLESLFESHFLAVVGSSGCGKSSLIRAGLIPALLGGFLVEDRAEWRIGVMRPGDAPLRHLVEALTDGEEEQTELLSAIGERHIDAVVDYVRPVLGESANQLLLIDQFEEIFSFRGGDGARKVDLGRDERLEQRRRRSEAADFVDLIVGLSARDDLPLYTVTTMRTDFLGDCDVFYGLPEAMNRGRYLVPRLTRQQLREAIEGPALLSGTALAPRLLDQLLNELGDRFDRLPVLQHALMRTWDAWNQSGTSGPIDQQHFEAAGTLENALSKHAEEGIEEEDLDATKRIFQRLTDTDAGSRRVRRPSSLDDLVDVSGLDRDGVLAILERFRGGGRHFVYVSRGSSGDDARVDISHESLIRQWERLREWVDAERDSRDRFAELVKGARRRAEGRTSLLQDPDLQIQLDWRERRTPDAVWAKRYSRKSDDFEVAMEFLEHSDEAARAAKRRRWIVRALSVLSVIAVVVTIFGIQRRSKTRELNAQIVSEAADLLDTDPNRAFEMLGRISNPDTKATRLIARALNYGFIEKSFTGHEGTVWTASFSPDGERVLTASDDGTARIWSDPDADEIELSHEQGGSRPRTAIAVSRDGAQVVAGSDDGTVEIWVVGEDLGETAEPLVLRGHTAAVNDIAFSVGGELLVTASEDGTARVWPLVGTGVPRELTYHRDAVLAAAISPDGSRVVTASRDGSAVLWDVAGVIPPMPLRGHSAAVVDAAFSPDGTMVVTASADKTARVWNVEWQAGVVTLEGHEGSVVHAAFAPDPGISRVVTASADGSARVWDIPTPDRKQGLGLTTIESRRRFRHDGPVNYAEFSPDGRQIVTASADKTARIWDVAGSASPVVLEGHAGEVRQASFKADSTGSQVVTVSDDGSTRIWPSDGQGAAKVLGGLGGALIGVGTSPEWGFERIVTASRDGTVEVWETSTSTDIPLESHAVEEPVTGAWFDDRGERVLTITSLEARVWDLSTKPPSSEAFRGHSERINFAAFSPTDDAIVTASEDGTARIWRLGSAAAQGTEARRVLPLEHQGEAVVHAAFSPDGRRLVTSAKDGVARVWNLDRLGQLPLELPAADGAPALTFADFDATGERVVTAARDGVARIWRLDRLDLGADGQPLPSVELEGHGKPIYMAKFSHQGALVVTASRDLTARVWRADGHDSDRPLVLAGHEGPLISASFSPDDKAVLTASEDGAARVWRSDGSDRRNPLVLLRYSGPVRAAAFSPDGSRVVTASQNGSVQIWSNVRVGVPAEVLRRHRDAVFAASFGPRGDRVVTVSRDGTSRLWSPHEGGDKADGDDGSSLLAGPEGRGRAAAFSPDGQSVAIALLDGTARIWSKGASGHFSEVTELHGGGSGAALLDVAWSPNGRRLITASGDGSATVWSLRSSEGASRTVEQVRRLEGHGRAVSSATWSPDGRRIATASFDGTVRVWERGEREPVVFDAHKGPVRSARFSPDGKRIVSTSPDGEVWVWSPDRPPDRMLLKDPQEPPAEPNEEAVSTEGDPAADPEEASEPAKVFPGRVRDAFFSSDGSRVVTAGEDAQLVVWDAATGERLETFEGESPFAMFATPEETTLTSLPAVNARGSKIVDGEVSHDRSQFVGVDRDGTVMIQPRATGSAPPIVLAGQRGKVLATAFNTDGSRVWTFSAYGLREWNVDEDPPEFMRSDYFWLGDSFDGGGDEVTFRDAVFDATASRIVLLEEDGTAWLWKTDPGPGEGAVRLGEAVRIAEFSPDGRRVATGREDGVALIWAVPTKPGDPAGEPLITLEGHRFPVRDVSFSRDGRQVATASEDGTVRVWETATGELLGLLEGHRFPVRSVEFSHDGGKLVTASEDGSARVWGRAADGGTWWSRTLRRHDGPVLTASFSPDGTRVVTTSEDGTARVWEDPQVEKEEPMLLLGHLGPVLTASFGPRGEQLVTASEDGTVRVWKVSREGLLESIFGD